MISHPRRTGGIGPASTATRWASRTMPLPPESSPLEVGLALVERLVKEHYAVVAEVDVGPDGTGTYVLSIPARPACEEPERLRQ